MARTMMRGSQIRPSTVGQNEVLKGYVDLSSDQVITGTKLFNNSILTSPPKTISSVNGVVTLTNESNVFEVDGTEDVTEIKGWNTGVCTIIWLKNRKVLNTANKIEMQGATNRDVIAGDTSTLIFLGDSHVRELHYFRYVTEAQNAAYTVEIIAESEITEIDLPITPESKNFMIVTRNGVKESTSNFSIGEKKMILNTPLDIGDELSIFIVATVSSTLIEESVKYGASKALRYAIAL